MGPRSPSHLTVGIASQAFRYLIRQAGLVTVLAVFLLPVAARPETDICGYPVSGRVAIQRGKQVLAVFTVTEADTVARRRRGLMNCPALSPGTGMLFVYADARARAFWMKDTPLELAILFIAADGRIIALERGIPQSLTRISSPGPVQYVLEINYEEIQGLQIGDRMHREHRSPANQP